MHLSDYLLRLRFREGRLALKMDVVLLAIMRLGVPDHAASRFFLVMSWISLFYYGAVFLSFFFIYKS